MRVTIRYGIGNELTKDLPGHPTVGSVLRDPHIKAELGYSDNVAGHIGGIPQPDDLLLSDGNIVTVSEPPCEKSMAVLRHGPYAFFFWKGEVIGQEPPHIHVEHAGRIAKFWLIPTIKVAKPGPYKPHELRKVRRIIEQYSEVLITSWYNAQPMSGG